MKRALCKLLLGLILLSQPFQARAFTPQEDNEILRDFLWKRFTNLPKDERPKIGLALSAGGVRGFAHVGVLEVLHNAGVPVDMISGTSMGAVVGSLYASGLPTSKLWEIGDHINLGAITPDFNVMGLFRFLFAEYPVFSRNPHVSSPASSIPIFTIRSPRDLSYCARVMAPLQRNISSVSFCC